MDLSSLITLATEQAVEAAAEHPEGSAGFIGTLGINWKLFLAQLLNFGIVLFILWKWVMKPVVGALESRRVKIEQSLKKAQDIEERLQKFEEHKEGELRRIRVQGQEILNQANAAAASAKAETVAAGRAEAERIMQETKQTIAAEKDQMMAELREEVAGLTVMATEKILREKLDGTKDKRLIEEVIKSFK